MVLWIGIADDTQNDCLPEKIDKLKASKYTIVYVIKGGKPSTQLIWSEQKKLKWEGAGKWINVITYV